MRLVCISNHSHRYVIKQGTGKPKADVCVKCSFNYRFPASVETDTGTSFVKTVAKQVQGSLFKLNLSVYLEIKAKLASARHCSCFLFVCYNI